jgi:hypothetical protein
VCRNGEDVRTAHGVCLLLCRACEERPTAREFVGIPYMVSALSAQNE